MPIAALLQLAAALVGPSATILRVAAPLATRPSCAVRHPAVRCAGSPAERSPASQRWGPVIQGPFGRSTRATVRRELVRGRIWSFEQVQGLLYVHVPVRMTAVRLDTGGLLLYSAIAPTAECLSLLAEVEEKAGPVQHILLPSLAVEHKTYAADFGRARPAATVWVVPDQYTFPLPLPLSLQGFPRGVRALPVRPTEAELADIPWARQLSYRVLGPIKEDVGAFEELLALDTATRTLLCTDLIVSVPSSPPEILQYNDVRALLYHARDTPSQAAPDTPASRREGWRKICLFALYFECSALEVPSPPDGTLGGAARFFRSAFPEEVPPEARRLGWAGFLAWRWRPTWQGAFERLRGGGRPIVPPILQVAVLNREPARVVEFADGVATDWDFNRIIPCHFDAPIRAGPAEWRSAFDFLRPGRSKNSTPATLGRRAAEFFLGGSRAAPGLPAEDMAFLRTFEASLVKAGTLRPAPPIE